MRDCADRVGGCVLVAACAVARTVRVVCYIACEGCGIGGEREVRGRGGFVSRGGISREGRRPSLVRTRGNRDI